MTCYCRTPIKRVSGSNAVGPDASKTGEYNEFWKPGYAFSSYDRRQPVAVPLSELEKILKLSYVNGLADYLKQRHLHYLI